MVYPKVLFRQNMRLKGWLQVLRQSGGALELVDESPRLPELRRVQGLRTWSLKAKGSWFSSFQEAEQVPHSFPDAKVRMDLVYLKYRTLNLTPPNGLP